MQNFQKSFSESDIRINNRSSIDISGVEEILSYDESSIVLVVCGVRLVIEGEGLRIGELRTAEGKIFASGRICSLIYEEAQAKKSRFPHNLFKA